MHRMEVLARCELLVELVVSYLLSLSRPFSALPPAKS